MDGVGTFSMAKVLQDYKMMTVITKSTSVDTWRKAIGTGVRLQSVSVCTGTNIMWDPDAPDYKTMKQVLTSFPDVKFITEGGGGAAGDPIALVDKYFGPRIVEMIPSGASSEEIAIFTERVLTKVRDANGLTPGDPRFDRMTARFVEDFARGGLAKILEV